MYSERSKEGVLGHRQAVRAKPLPGPCVRERGSSRCQEAEPDTESPPQMPGQRRKGEEIPGH